MAGRHIDTNANTIMRDPAWNKQLRVSTLAMHPQDAEALQLSDGQTVAITTEAASLEIELEITESTRPGMVRVGRRWPSVSGSDQYGMPSRR